MADKLPVVFPLLLYNGIKKWTAPTNLSELIQKPFKGMEPFIPAFKYYKISENEFDKKDNLVKGLFRLELSNINEMASVTTEMLKILKNNVSKELQLDFGLWLRRIFKIKKNENIDILAYDGEVNNMLAEKLKIYEKELILKGRQEGIEEGRQEGIQKGRQEGIQKGIQKGIEEGKKETALQMLKMRLDIDLIVQVTGLTKEQILDLEKN